MVMGMEPAPEGLGAIGMIVQECVTGKPILGSF